MEQQSSQAAPSVRGKVVWVAVLSAVSALYLVQARASGEAPVGPVTADVQSAATVTKIAGVKRIAPPEKAVTSVSKKTVDHASPAQNFQSVLKHVPGMNVISQGPGNLSATDNEFTYQGFTSSQMASNFDGIPIINTFRGGAGGTGDDHAYTPFDNGANIDR
ncbi:MAG: TonB-dependent receptor plug domain-containing protein [Acidithiobacillus sp.]